MDKREVPPSRELVRVEDRFVRLNTLENDHAIAAFPNEKDATGAAKKINDYHDSRVQAALAPLRKELELALSNARRWEEANAANRDEAMQQQDLKLGEKQKREKAEAALRDMERQRDELWDELDEWQDAAKEYRLGYEAPLDALFKKADKLASPPVEGGEKEGKNGNR